MRARFQLAQRHGRRRGTRGIGAPFDQRFERCAVARELDDVHVLVGNAAGLEDRLDLSIDRRVGFRDRVASCFRRYELVRCKGTATLLRLGDVTVAKNCSEA